MSTREARGIQSHAEEDAVVRYLQHNTDFFERHLPLLARLRLPHVRGDSTISLIERQVEVLRERHTQMEQKLADFVSVARANDAVAEKMHRFTRRRLRARTRAAAVEQLEASLREDFDAFHSVLVLVDMELPAHRFVHPVSRDDAALKSFESLFASGKPRCGQARDSQREFLFAGDAPSIGSMALVPLGEKGSLGLLALGSADRDRYHPGMSTEFLARLGELISDVLTRP
ncbi:MAG TPA: DUF484 family protein [Steroidobacteraceae bacterium]|nr:DUF484 family protein [Steroidobacteraceae bacterium]